MDDLYELLGIDREEARKPRPTPCCGVVRPGGIPDDDAGRMCINRCCVEYRCANCGTYCWGWGPAGCRCRPDKRGKGGPNPVPQMRDYHRRTRYRSHRLRG